MVVLQSRHGKSMHRLGKLGYMLGQGTINTDEERENQGLDDEGGLKHCVYSCRGDDVKTLENSNQSCVCWQG